MPNASSRESGQAMVEFVLSAMTFLFAVLGVIQLALVLNAYSLVRYAAYNAARAGIVHNGDIDVMRDAARISMLAVFPRHGRADHIRGFTENYLGALATDDLGLFTYFGEPITEVKVLHKDNMLCGTSITFDDPRAGRDALLTVQVVHQYELVIPLVNRIIFWLHMRYKQGNRYHGEETVDSLAAKTDKMRRTGEFRDIEYRIPLVAHNTMRMQSDYIPSTCITTTTTTTSTTTSTSTSTSTTTSSTSTIVTTTSSTTTTTLRPCQGRCCPGQNNSCTGNNVTCMCDQACRTFNDCCWDAGVSCGW